MSIETIEDLDDPRVAIYRNVKDAALPINIHPKRGHVNNTLQGMKSRTSRQPRLIAVPGEELFGGKGVPVTAGVSATG